MRLLTAICIAAIVIAFAMPAFAETQNIKVSGDIAVAHVYQKDIDLCNSGGSHENDNENFVLQQVGLNVGADLTDNVSTYLRIINERDWNAKDETTIGFDVSLDEAYVTLKEMLYAPLTVKVGRQNLWLGKGFVIGNAGIGAWDAPVALPITIKEVSDMTAFDAVKATLDYDPWTIDLIYSKINGGAGINIADDIDLYITNVGYKFTKYDAEAESYCIVEYDQTNRNAGTSLANNQGDINITTTLGLRGSLVPFENFTVWAEGAYQGGKYGNRTTAAGFSQDREAGAFDIGAEYVFADAKWTPKLALEYVWWSGESLGPDGQPGGDWGAWNSLYPGKFDTQIAAFRNITKYTEYDGAAADTTANNNGATNESQILVKGNITPMADIKVDGTFAYLWYDEAPRSTADPNRQEELGCELDGMVTYDYTEDVTFKVAGGLFLPGDYYKGNVNKADQDHPAGQVISSVKVEF